MAAEANVPSVREQIPTAEFIEDLTAYMSKEGTAEAVIEKLQRMYSALKFIEQKLVQRKAKLKAKIPEIEATYGALKQMRSQAELGEPLIAHYELAQSVFAKAKVNVHEEDKVTPPPHRTLAFHTAHHAHHGTFTCARAARCTRRLHARWVKQTHRVLAAEAAYPSIAPAHGLLALSSPLLPALWELGGVATEPCAGAQLVRALWHRHEAQEPLRWTRNLSLPGSHLAERPALQGHLLRRDRQRNTAQRRRWSERYSKPVESK